MSEETNIVKNSYEVKWAYFGPGIAFVGTGSCSSGNDFAENIIIFGVDNLNLSS